MKRIGLIGGTSWPSTVEYYRLLNELVAQKLGGFHSAKLLLHSIDYHEIKSSYGLHWEKIPDLLEAEIDACMRARPDCLMICNNTLHKAFDVIAPHLKLPVPFFHAVDLTAEHAVRQGYKHVLLLATRMTMEDGYYTRKLEERGLRVTIPGADTRAQIQAIQSELAVGRVLPEHRTYFEALLKEYAAVDGVVLACTELPLAITQERTVLPIINPIQLQCRAAVEYALS